MMEENPLGLTHARWEIARAILTGERTTELMEVPTLRDAARAADVTVAMLHRWKVRSEEKRPDDEPWIYEIAQVFQDLAALQEAAVEELLLYRGIHGVEERTTRTESGETHDGKEAVQTTETVKIKPETNVLIRFLELRQKGRASKPGDLNKAAALDVDEWLKDALSDPEKAERTLTFLERRVAEQGKRGGILH